MATVTTPRDSLIAEKLRGSPAASQTSSRAGSPDSLPKKQNGIAAPSTENLNGNGYAAPPSEPQKSTTLAAPQPEKPSMTKRLTRMFSTKDATRAEGHISSQQSSTGHSTPKPPPTPTTEQKPNPPSRKSSTTDKAITKTEKSEKPTTTLAKDKKAAGTASAHQRFVLNADVKGGHEHHLKSAKRQEKLSDMLRNVISGKAKAPEHVHEGEQQLSLMSSWVDQLKSERDSLVSEKKGGPNATASLVEKYGKCQEIVGRGAFGIVRISHKRSENGTGEQLYAVKEFRRRPEENEKKYSKRLTSEFCISSSLRHPNVIHTLDLLQDSKGDYCEVMEFCAGGDLYTLVLAAGKLEVMEADCYFKQMMRGVEYMHEMGVAHRDLKPENLLLTTHGSLKITDFGNGECFRMAWESDAHMVTGLCGSAPYIAPEEYIDKEFDARAVDVWATGVIYMAMRTGRHLWRVAKKDEDEFYERYLEGRRDEEGYAPIESLHRARCRNVIYSILDPNPSRRITASQVLKSEWGREIKLCKAGEEGL
ncbi:serine/threonine-protein kinase HAL4/sat4 [Cadophora gregata]|uniref:serine/threonine-protein kinase HAL4/sat4 n=1 Tax=Cadophora gregata TaxID=51156 RepID=UPI0026DB95C0|nr:serine/threonine-protein kinase HAL4/sat4 [Cadophora gregata]KAK0100059.1 serine/threonine-protein kinase HAL4/sat4 [Cadophora gregata f. sp. sojae]KAK0116094.1 serine/threonine-protein kinase HAL4/sat4 [Cadophora gregata]